MGKEKGEKRKAKRGKIKGRDGQKRGGKGNITKEEVKDNNLLVLQTYKCSPSARRKSLYFELAVRGPLGPSVQEGNCFLPP